MKGSQWTNVPPKVSDDAPMINPVAIQVYYDLVMQAVCSAKVPRAARIDEIAGIMCASAAVYASAAGDSAEAKEAFFKLMDIFYNRTVMDLKSQGLIKERK